MSLHARKILELYPNGYTLEIPTVNGRYRIDDASGSYLVDVIDGVVLGTGHTGRKGEIYKKNYLANKLSVFFGPIT